MQSSAFHRTTTLIFGVVSYAVFLFTFLYTVGFLGNAVVPKSIDSGVAPAWPVAVAINLGLLLLFAVQHSGMARPAFKRAWTRVVPPAAERSMYVLLSSVVFLLLFWAWQPMPGVIFQAESEFARAVLTGLLGAGVCLVLYSTFLIDHFDLFGLRQVVLHFRGRPYTDKRFVTPSLYKHVRHPLYVGWFITLWATPDMTMGHLLIAGVSSLYMLSAVVLEERDLSHLLGDEYRAYRDRTPMFIPRPTVKTSTTAASH